MNPLSVITRLFHRLTAVLLPGVLLWPLMAAFAFAEGDGDGDGGDDSGDGGDDGSDSDDDDTGDDDTDDNADTSGNDDARFSQADIDRIISREKAKLTAKAVKDAELAKLDEAERLKAEKADADQAAKDAKTSADKRVIRADAKVAAAAAGVHKDQLGYVLRLADLSGVEVDEDGEPDPKAIGKAVNKVLSDIPALKGEAPAKKSGNDLNGAKDEQPKSLADAVTNRYTKTS